MGCGCNKSKSTPAGTSAPRRATVYQVLTNGSVLSEHNTLPEARAAATTAGGRVKVTSKLV